MRDLDSIILIVGDSTVAASTIDALEMSRTARLTPPIVLDVIRVAVDDRLRVAELGAKLLDSLDRETRHPKEQTHPRSPKARFRKGR